MYKITKENLIYRLGCEGKDKEIKEMLYKAYKEELSNVVIEYDDIKLISDVIGNRTGKPSQRWEVSDIPFEATIMIDRLFKFCFNYNYKIRMAKSDCTNIIYTCATNLTTKVDGLEITINSFYLTENEKEEYTERFYQILMNEMVDIKVIRKVLNHFYYHVIKELFLEILKNS